MSASQVIELNGHRYDAKTGKQIGHPARKVSKAPMNASVDGISKRAHPPRTVASAAKKRTQKSQTLRRSVVSKPQPVHKVTTSAKQRTSTAKTSVASKTTQPSRHKVPAARMQRVKSVSQSKLIRRFNTDVSPVVQKHATKAKQQASSMVQAVSSVVEQPATQFSRAIEQATSHTASKSRKTPVRHRVARKLRISPKTLNVGSMVVAALLLVGYFGYHSAPNLSMHLATMRSQVDGDLPGYLPNGFSLDRDIAYKPGEITLAYQSNSDERYFEVKQSASQWDSDALAQNFVSEKDQVRTIQNKGKTIYLYDESNATWVDGGVWYRIEGESLLNSDQLSRLANSL